MQSAADLSGKNLRAPGAPALVSLFTALGASPVSMQFGEVYTSQQTKVVARAFNEVALIERDELAKLDSTLHADLEKKGITFTKPDHASFRDNLPAVGFYEEWRGKIGNQAWTLLDKHVGKLA